MVPLPAEVMQGIQTMGVEADFEQVALWMRHPRTCEQVQHWLCNRSGRASSRTDARLLLAILFADVNADDIFDRSTLDQVMRREARALRAAFDGATTANDNEGTSDDDSFDRTFVRVKRVYKAWMARDRNEMVQQLQAMIVACKHDHTTPPDEQLLGQLRQIGGEDAAVRAREAYARHEVVTARQMAERVAQTARRAFWDVVRDDIRAQRYDSLYHVLDELSRAMRALVAHSERHVSELEDTFDAAWLRQRIEADSLDPDEIHALMSHLARTIASWQAAVDRDVVVAWADSVCRTEHTIEALLGHALVTFLAEAHEHLGQIYMRIVELDSAAARDEASPATTNQ